MIPFEALEVAGFAIAFAALNRIRGSSIPGGAWIAAIALGVAAFCLSGRWFPAAAVTVAYIFGEAIDGWTAWIVGLQKHMTQAIFNRKLPGFDDTGRRAGAWRFASLFADPHIDFRKFCIAGMAYRGVVWFAPVFAVLWGFGLASWWQALAATLICGALMPVSYFAGSALATKATREGEKVKYLRWAEPIYGAAYGAALGIAV
ncbi:MAG: hypothetical protein GY802_05160 [Gammaproteobacteria bacterium]|nr:hypothetical protein [Gammaproteobacteria bacterium]